jgi:hypothetical protein
VVCLQTTRRGHSDEENGPCFVLDGCEPYRNSSPYTPQPTTISTISTISTRKDTSTADQISSSNAPPLWLSGPNFVRHNATVTGHSGTGSHLSDSTRRASWRVLRCCYPTPESRCGGRVVFWACGPRHTECLGPKVICPIFWAISRTTILPDHRRWVWAWTGAG